MKHAGNKIARLRDAGQLVRVHQTGKMFVEDVAGPDVYGVRSGKALILGTESGGKAFDQGRNLGRACRVAGGAPDAGKSRNVLAQRMAGHEAIAAVPSAHRLARSGQTCAFAVDLQQPVVIEGEICGVNAVILLLERPARQLDRIVIEFGQGA